MITEYGFEDGGPAFPEKDLGGMSLRDYFAAKTVPALLHITAHKVSPHTVEDAADYHRHLANTAYELADAMLKARETPHG